MLAWLKLSGNLYLRPDRVLDAGEAVGGFHGRNKYSTCFSSSYADYKNSLDKLFDLDIAHLNIPHTGVLSGEVARQQIVETKSATEKNYNEIRHRLNEGETIEEIFQSMLKDWSIEEIAPNGPFTSSREELLKGMINAVAEKPVKKEDS